MFLARVLGEWVWRLGGVGVWVAWDLHFAGDIKNAEITYKITRLRALYEKDPKDFCRLAGEEIGRWKAEYRSRN